MRLALISAVLLVLAVSVLRRCVWNSCRPSPSFARRAFLPPTPGRPQAGTAGAAAAGRGGMLGVFAVPARGPPQPRAGSADASGVWLAAAVLCGAAGAARRPSRPNMARRGPGPRLSAAEENEEVPLLGRRFLVWYGLSVVEQRSISCL